MHRNESFADTIRARLKRIDKADALLAVVLLLAAFAYLQHDFAFFLNDDEGTYAYAVWRTSLGEVPYRDFLTSEMPAFLYWGALLVRLFGRSFVALRVATVLALFLAAWLLYAANRELLGRPVAVLSAGLFLVELNVFHYGRYFRAETYMLLFQLAGTYAFILGTKRRRLRYTALAGVLFGLSILNKLFGLLPLAGCFLYLLYAWLRDRRPYKEVFLQGLALGGPALLLVGAVTLLFARIAPYFVTAVFTHHTMSGAGMPLAERAANAFVLYQQYVAARGWAVALAAAGALILLWRRRALASLAVWQIPTVLAFAVMSRPLWDRHLFYLSPSLVTLVAVALAGLLSAQRRVLRISGPWPAILRPVVLGATLALSLAAVYPWIQQDAQEAARAEQDSPRWTALIRSLTAKGDAVMADYPGLNFLAGRRSTFWAAEMSATGARSGQIRGSALISELEKGNVALVVINAGLYDPQMTVMTDYPDFRCYLRSHYALVDKFHETWSGNDYEIYARADVPQGPSVQYGDELALVTTCLSDTPLRAGSTLTVDTRWQALGAPSHDYHVSAFLVDSSGRQWAEAHARLCEGNGAPTAKWSPQQMGSGSFGLPLNPAMPAGDYYLVIQPYYAGSTFLQPSSPPAGPTVQGLPVIATVHVLPPAQPPATPPEVTIAHPLTGVSFGPHFDLLGYDLSTTQLAPGDTVQVTLYWAYRQPSTIDYKLFVHLLDSTPKIQGQHDAVPTGGGALTTGWVQGDVLVDRFDVPLDPAAPQGTLQIEVGFYDLATGERLPLLQDGRPIGDDRFILPTTITAR